MSKRKRGFTAAQTKTTSRRMRSATLGTHVPRRARATSRHMNADAVGFSNMRKKKRAARGIVHTLLPSTETRESSSDYARRVSRQEFAQDIQRKARIRRIGIIVVAAIVVVAVAGVAGIATFLGSLDSRMGLGDSDAKTALVAPQEGSPSYTLFVADLGSTSAATDEEGPDVLILARIDEDNRAATFIAIPTNLQVTLSDSKTYRMRDVAAQGDAALISTVADFAGVDIAHYVKTDAKGIEHFVDTIGGVELYVEQEVDDPTAGDVYIPTGTQELDGNAALTYLRARNFSNGSEVQAQNQAAFLATVVARMLDTNGSLAFAALLDSVGGDVRTDVSAMETIAFADALRGMDASSVYRAPVPGYERDRDGVTYYIASSDAWTSMMERVKTGENPLVDEGSSTTVDRGSFTVTVNNGTDIVGGASQIAEALRADGFNVTEVGNTEGSIIYEETLVIYDGDEQAKAQAEETVAALGTGRVVVGAGHYTYATDILVILGTDWKPVV